MKFFLLILAIAAAQTTLTPETLWRYKVDGTEAEEGWNTDSFSGNWPSATATNLPTPTGKVSYYCATFGVTDVDGYATIKTEVTTRGGYRVFFNGVEAGRTFIPYGDITFATEPIEEVEAARGLKMGMDFDYANIAAHENLMCIEVRTKTVDTANFFACTLTLVGTENDLIADGVLGYSHYGYYDPTWHEHYPNAHDKNTNNKWCVMDDDVYEGTERAWLTWKWNDNRAQVVNYWKLYTGNMPDRRPRNIAIYGTNDDCGSGLTPDQTNVNWTLLGQFQPNFYTAYYGQNKEFTVNNNMPYRCYKMEFWLSYLQGIEVGEFYLGMKQTVQVCAAQNGFEASYKGTLAYKECPQEGWAGGIFRECTGSQLSTEEIDTCHPLLPESIVYGENNLVNIPLLKNNNILPVYSGLVETWSIYPTLPADLTFNTTTGAITGRLQALFEGEQVYTVTATNSYGFLQVNVTTTSSIVHCSPTELYPATNHGENAVTTCPVYYTGYALAQCLGGEFEEPNLDHCIPRESTIFTYGISSATYLTGVEISPLTLLSDFPASRVFVMPDLPAGLTLSMAGVISGTPTAAASQTTYTISAVNRDISLNAEITITVIDNSCPAIDSFPEAANGANSTSTTACPTGRSGTVVRTCTNGEFSEPDYSGCTLVAPSGFSYSPSTLSVVAGEGKAASFSVTGVDLFFSVSPDLPAGFTMESGYISGKGTTVGSTTHTVTATNEGGSTTAVITIVVTNAGCTGLDGANVAHGAQFTEECPSGYEGTAFRICTNGVLGTVDRTGCVLKAPSDLSYGETNFVLTINNFFSTPYPIYNGTISSFTTEPELPAGLQINPTGFISGMISDVLSLTSYNVTGTNESGSTSTVISLTGVLPTCSNLKEYGVASAGDSVTFDCTKQDGYKGTSTRTCVLNEAKNAAQWSKPTEFCIEKKVDIFMLIGIILIIVGILFIVWGILLMIKRDNKTLPKKPESQKAPAPVPAPKAPTPAPTAPKAPTAPVAPTPVPAPAPAAPAPAPAPAPSVSI